MHRAFLRGQAAPICAQLVGLEVLLLVGPGLAVRDEPADRVIRVNRIRRIRPSCRFVRLLTEEPQLVRLTGALLGGRGAIVGDGTFVVARRPQRSVSS